MGNTNLGRLRAHRDAYHSPGVPCPDVQLVRPPPARGDHTLRVVRKRSAAPLASRVLVLEHRGGGEDAFWFFFFAFTILRATTGLVFVLLHGEGVVCGWRILGYRT